MPDRALERERFLAAIVESCDDAIIGKTVDARIVSWNAGAERMYGYSAEEVLGRPVSIVVPPDRRDELWLIMERIKRGEPVTHFETVRLTKDGRRIDVSLTISPIKGASGEITGASTIARDITDRRRAEEALRKSEATARAFLESAAEGIVAVDRHGRITLVNPRAADMFGYRREELLGEQVELLIPERVRGAHVAHRADYFSRPRARSMGLGLDLTGRRKNGTEFPIEVSLSFVPDEQGSLAMAFITDISDRVAMERQARQVEKLTALGTLAAGIAHEVNNPIGVISSRIELMLLEAEGQDLPVEHLEDLRVLHRHAQRLGRIAESLLSFARQHQRELRPVDVNDVVEETLMLVGKQISKGGIHVLTALDPTLPPVLGDATALGQVLMNLVLNSRDAMPNGGTLRIETSRVQGQPGSIRLAVSDTGCGIPPEVLGKISEPFFTTKPEGTGLGLSVSYKIVREHGGTVEVRSEPGHGTTFTIVLPRSSSPRTGPASGQPAPA